MPTRIVHFEIPADDTGKGIEFWSSLFGWEFESFPGPFEYHMTRISDQTGGAITNMEPGKKGTRAYFAVDEINAGAARVNELGGHADEPRPVPRHGLVRNLPRPPGKRVRPLAERLIRARPGLSLYIGLTPDDRVPGQVCCSRARGRCARLTPSAKTLTANASRWEGCV